MPAGMHFELCPETGIGCLIINKGEESIKIDMMPDEAANLQSLVRSGDLQGAKAMLTEIEAGAETVLDRSSLEALARELK